MHPFAEFIRLLGRGKTLSRGLTPEEAERAMAHDPRRRGAARADRRLPDAAAHEGGDRRRDRRLRARRRGRACRRRRRRVPISIGPATPARRAARPGICSRRCGSPAPAIASRCTGSTATRRAASTPARRWRGSACRRRAISPQAQRNSASAASPISRSTAFAPNWRELLMLKPVLGLRSAVNTLARSLNPFAAPAPRCRRRSIPATCRSTATRRWRWATRASGAFAATAARTSGGRRSRVEIAAAENGVARDFTLPPLIDGAGGERGAAAGRGAGRRSGAAATTRAPTPPWSARWRWRSASWARRPRRRWPGARALGRARPRPFPARRPGAGPARRRRRWAKSISSAPAPARPTC